MRYRLSEIAKICGGRLCGADCEVCGVETDSRNCAFGKDVMFVAMRGANHDSHNFVAEMYERGVRAFMCEKECECGEGAGCVVVENAVEALQRLAESHREHISGVVVGITGSNGKTIVKEWIAQCLPAGVKLFRSPRSYNSQLGVALSLLMAEGDEELVLIEAGISQPGEMARLERMIRPKVVVVTSLGDAHQEGFESLTQKIEEKLLLAKGADTIIYHSAYPEVAHAVESLGAVKVDAAKMMPKAEFADVASIRNAQIVEALFEVLGYEAPDFEALQPVAMRLEVKEGINGSLLVNDAYNSDINSLAIALDYLHSVAAGRRKVLILSDILQSGMSDDELYTRVARLIAESGVEWVIGVGDKISASRAAFEGVKSSFYASTDEFLHRMNGRDFADAALLLKGNRASRFEKIS
ncbi:MAG: alanine racemase, partial [Alistipes sp.]|nr:alanine racemase [Alistipes sp.]